MKQFMKRKLLGGMVATIAAVLIMSLCMSGTAYAAAPSIDEVELKGKKKVEVDFHGDVEYKNVKVIVKNPGGKKYKAKIVKKDDDDITFVLRKHKAGKTYRFTIKGVRQQNTTKYGKVKGSVTIPKKNGYIGKKAALAIALKDAGFAAGDVTALKCELDLDDAVVHYDVDFKQGGKEYDYDIDATTGAILQSRSEVDD